LVVARIVLPEVPPVGVASNLQRRLTVLWLLLPLAEAVGLVVRQAAIVAIGPSGAVPVVAVDRAARGIDGDLVEVDAEAVALRIGVVEQAGLQHLVGRDADARHEVARREGALFDVGEEVLWIAV